MRLAVVLGLAAAVVYVGGFWLLFNLDRRKHPALTPRSNMSRYAKLIAALLGALTEVAALGFLPESHSEAVTVVVAFLTAVSVYAVPNRPA